MTNMHALPFGTPDGVRGEVGVHECGSSSPVFLPVRTAYDRWAASYDTYDNPMVFTAGRALLAGMAKTVAGKSVFEFGCGTGRNLACLKGAGASGVAGCDFSSGMLSVALERNPGAKIFPHDISQPLPAMDESFDAILFSLTLEHLPDLVTPLGEAARILRAGGRIHILEIHPYLSSGGVAAHFEDGGQQVNMPAYPHQISTYLNAFAEICLGVLECHEWRPRDLGEPAPLKAMKRGPDFPMLIEFTLESKR